MINDSGILEDFLAEVSDLMATLSDNLFLLGKNFASKHEIDEIFRIMHTIKGTSSFLKFDNLTEHAHVLETFLGNIRKNKIVLNRDKFHLLNSATDILVQIISSIRDTHSDQVLITNNSIKKIKELNNLNGYNIELNSTVDNTSKERTEVLREMDLLVKNMNTESTSDNDQIVKEQEFNNKNELKGMYSQSMRVNTDRLDKFFNKINELIVSKNRLTSLSKHMEHSIKGNDSELRSLRSIANYISMLINDIQISVLNIRTLPINTLLKRYPILIEELASSLNKDIKIKIISEYTEIDRIVLEKLRIPIMHIIRNACDHGIEYPMEREKIGKNRTGMITMHVHKKGSYLVISISDDGAGIDRDKVIKKALDKKIIIKEQLKKMNDKDILNLIFYQYFSTSEKITDVSGRGIGMDIVKNQIEKLNGNVDIISSYGRGTTINIRVPITLSIQHVLIVLIGGKIFAIPLEFIKGNIVINAEDIKSMNNFDVVEFNHTFFLLVDPKDILNIDGVVRKRQKYTVLIMEYDNVKLAFIVENVIGQKDIVIKLFNKYLGKIDGFIGTTVIEDDIIVPVIDPFVLFENTKKYYTTYEKFKIVLIIENKNIIENIKKNFHMYNIELVVYNNYNIFKNGINKLDFIDIFIVDLEIVMEENGLKAIKYINSNIKYRKIPIIILDNGYSWKLMGEIKDIRIDFIVKRDNINNDLYNIVCKLLNLKIKDKV